MRIEQIIEFQLRGSGPLGRTCTPIIGKLHDKTKISSGKSSNGLLFIAKILQEAMCLNFSQHGPNHLQLKFYTIMQEFKRVLDFNCR